VAGWLGGWVAGWLVGWLVDAKEEHKWNVVGNASLGKYLLLMASANTLTDE